MLAIHHDVTSDYYRTPTGPVPVGTQVRLRVSITGALVPVHSVRLFYVYGLESLREGYALMHPEPTNGDVRLDFSARLHMDEEPGLFFYWFEVRLEDGRYRWGFPDATSCQTLAETLPLSPTFAVDGSEPIPGFQITVHTVDFQTPHWMKGAVLYQIFPDRFNRGSQFDETRARDLMKWPERIWHSDWDEEVDYQGKSPGGYEACDFFGGTIAGICEKLDRLAAMGVSVLYLNPVFKARSNHRYDTGDYLTVDPLLGTDDDLTSLFSQAEKRGIHVILDGVFSHTGADSIYFNRYDRYDSVGAWQEQRDGTPSIYTSWYRFCGEFKPKIKSPDRPSDDATTCPVERMRMDKAAQPWIAVCHEGLDESPNHPIPYECWWDFPTLPNVDENDLSYRAFIGGPGGVLAKWIRAGCAGFRLDVSDELPDSFLRFLRKRIKYEREDAYILGEIWEEPTAKISYGYHRDFLFGTTHDAVMGYTFRCAVIAFLKHEITAANLAFAFKKMISVTPKQALYAQMNLLGSHDTKRIITELAGLPCPNTRAGQASLFLTDEERANGEQLVVLASLLQVAFPGAMAVYYGDEVGMEGYEDPFNRRTFPWGQESAEGSENKLTQQLTVLMTLKNRTPALKTGHFEILYAQDDVIVIHRFITDMGRDAFDSPVDGPRELLIAVNRADTSFALPRGCGSGLLGPRSGLILLDGMKVFP
ncbi:MAG TPA: glycoside hydrolase family 13 protein [Clostridia bacterium]|nr:glycoside hydrolase family 13 protein [Clostridia bacterium]